MTFRLRKLNLKLLIIDTILYRILTIGLEFLFLWIVLDAFIENPSALALKLSLIWNGINMFWYFIYHRIFLGLFKIGKNEEK